MLKHEKTGRPIHVVFGILGTYLARGCSRSSPQMQQNGRRHGEEECMSMKATERLVRKSDFAAEVDVHLVEADGG